MRRLVNPSPVPVPRTAQELYGKMTMAVRAASTGFGSSSPYTQKKDVSLRPFIKGSKEVIGQRALEKQYKGEFPTDNEVRAIAVPTPHTHRGQSLHEGLPTDQRKKIAAIPGKKRRQNAAQIQSGLRTTPAITPMRVFDAAGNPTGQTTGHTGTYLDLQSGKFSHMSGQDTAHNYLRTTFSKVLKEKHSGPEMLSHMMAAQIDVMPTGRELLRDPGITGAQTNLRGIGKFGKPHTGVRGAIGTDRFSFATNVHQRREGAKDNLRSYNAVVRTVVSNAKLRDPSPKRHTLALGGEYMTKPPVIFARTPDVSASSSYPLAETAAALTKPLRLDLPEPKSGRK